MEEVFINNAQREELVYDIKDNLPFDSKVNFTLANNIIFAIEGYLDYKAKNMNSLEKQMYKSILNVFRYGGGDDEQAAKSTAAIALRLLKKCADDLYNEGVNAGVYAANNNNFNLIGSYIPFRKWLRDHLANPKTEDGKAE